MIGALYIDGKKFMDIDDKEIPVIDFTPHIPIDGKGYSLVGKYSCSGSFTLSPESAEVFKELFRKRKKEEIIRKYLCNNYRRMHNLPLIRRGSRLYWVRRYLKNYGYYG